jgi:diaminopimelate decarboxylase
MPQQIPKTPCVIYDAASVVRRYELLRSYLDAAYPRSRIFYALKACYVPLVVERLIHLGCGLEISSPSEQQIAMRFGLSGGQIVWNGPGLDEVTLRGTVGREEIVNIDSPHVFQVLSRIAQERGQEVRAGLRLNITGQGKLGVDPALAESLLQDSSRVRIVGFHFHPANGLKNPAEAQEQRYRFLDVLAGWERTLGVNPEFVNLGGGFAIGEAPPVLLDSLVERVFALKSRPELFLEPGAYLVADAATAYASVVALKTVAGACWAILDIGANFLVPLQRAGFTVQGTTPVPALGRVSFGGPLCYEADVIALEQRVGVCHGDIVKIERCGAYTASLCSNFASSPPPIYWKDGDSIVEVAHHSETYHDFLEFHGYLNRH